MKKVIFILMATAVMISCSKNQSGIRNEDLQGTYDADCSVLLKQLLNEDDEMKDNAYAMAFAELLVSDMKMTLTFTEDSLYTETTGSMVEFAQSFSDGKDDTRKAYQYEIRNDSLLYTKEEGKDYEEYGILRKTGNNCDSLLLIMKEENDKVNQISIVKRK